MLILSSVRFRFPTIGKMNVSIGANSKAREYPVGEKRVVCSPSTVYQSCSLESFTLTNREDGSPILNAAYKLF